MGPIRTVGDFLGFHHGLNSFSWSEQNHTLLFWKNFAVVLKKLLRRYRIVHSVFISLSFFLKKSLFSREVWKGLKKNNRSVVKAQHDSIFRKQTQKEGWKNTWNAASEIQKFPHHWFTKKMTGKKSPSNESKLYIYPNPSEPLWFHLT